MRSASASTLAASHALRAGPAVAQMAGSTTNSAVADPSSSAARSAGLSRTRRSRRNHITAEVGPRFEPRLGVDMLLNLARA